MIDPDANKHPGPLEGIRVLELGQLIAGPFAASMLAWFGAEVIKIEPPGSGDAIRNWRVVENGTSLWWRSISRNKKCITLNLREDAGRDAARQLADKSDVLIENFRPGTMEKWGLGPELLQASNPGLIFSRVSGYGQDGPYAERPGFASACEGIGGFRYINGFPGETPVRPNLSMGDTLAALHTVIGVLLALVHRGKAVPPKGQIVDTAIYESVFNMMESIVPEFDGAGVVREASGSTLTGIAPTNTYLCADGRYVIIGGNGDSIFQRLMETAGYAEMATDSRYANNAGRVEHSAAIDAAISAWTGTLNASEALDKLAAAAVPAGPIYSVRDMFEDPHFKSRGMFESVQVEDRSLTIPAYAPRLSDTPGQTRWPGPTEPGSHNQEVFSEILGLSDEQIARLVDAPR